jgi:hypothetical protein
MDVVETLKSLGSADRFWRLGNATAQRIALELDSDDRPLSVLPMRDVVVSGRKIPGMKPTVVVSEKKLITVHMPRFTRNVTTWLRSDIQELSGFSDRTCTFSTSDGQTVRIRGLYGSLDKKYEKMTQLFYQSLSTKSN